MSKTEKIFNVEFKSSTYRVYKVSAQDAEAAEWSAWKELGEDPSAPRAWTENAEVSSISTEDT